MGLYYLPYVEALLNSRCEIYASNVTKDLIIAIFENAIRVDLDERSTKKIRELLHRINGVLFFEKNKLKKALLIWDQNLVILKRKNIQVEKDFHIVVLN